MRFKKATASRTLATFAALAIIVTGCANSPSPAPSSAASPEASVGGNAPASAEASTAGQLGGKQWRIAMVSPLNLDLFDQEHRGAQLAADLVGAKLEFTTLGTTFTMENYISFIEPVIATKPDAIAFGFYSDGFAPLMEQAKAAGVLVVFVNGTPINNPDTAYPQYQQVGSSGPSEVDQGATLALSFTSHITTKGKILMVNNFPGSPDHQLRIDGATKVFVKAGFTTDVLNAAMDNATALANISSYLAAHPEIVAIFTTGLNSAVAACQYMKQNNLKLPVAVFDASKDTIGLVKDGCVTDLIDQQFFLEGFYAVMNAWTALEKKVVPVHMNTGTYMITQDNVDQYVAP